MYFFNGKEDMKIMQEYNRIKNGQLRKYYKL